jgi:ribose transport system ATP-binding protein
MLSLESLGDGRHFRNIGLEVRRGEIVGLAGLIGSGREEVVEAIYGLAKPTQGRTLLSGKPLRISSPSIAVANGIVLVPRDRRQDGLVLDMTVADNINLASLEDVSSGYLVRQGAAAARARGIVSKIDIRPKNVDTISRLLSGGNQQKVVLARWLATGSKLFILDEPTVGVDIGAKVEIYRLIEKLAADGAAVIVSSSDPSELLGLCDRIVVLLRGEVVANLTTNECSLDRLIALTTGGHAEEGAAA